MEEIQKFYTEDWNESQRLISQSGQIEYITTMKYMKIYCRKDMSVLDACAGCGVYSFPLADFNSFDVVLNLGSYYHLCDQTDREKSLSETIRVLKNGGIYIILYVNCCANYMAHFEELKDNFSFLVDYMQKGHIENSTLFYSTTPEMIEEDLKKYNLKLLHHVATDGPIFVYRDIVEHMSKKDFEAFMDIHLGLCDKKSNLGYSEHGLIVAQK